MKKGVFLIMLVLTAVLGITSISYAAELTWDTVPGHHNQSILLGPDEKFSKDVIWYPSRGEFLSNGILEITNQENGSIYICVDTFAHVNVD